MKQPYSILILIWLSLTAATSATGAQVTSCQPPMIDLSTPLCPADSPLLPENFPVAAVSVSDDTGGYDFVRTFVEKVLAAQPAHTPVIFLNVNDETFAKIKIYMQTLRPEALGQLRLVRSVDQDEFGFESQTRLNWQQDFVKSFFDPHTGSALPRFASHYPNIGGLVTQTASEMRACSLAVGEPLPDPQTRNGYAGGNIDTVGGVCLLGDSDLKPLEWEAYSKKVCAGSAARLKVPTAALVAHHVDEIFKMIPTGDGDCDFALSFASTRKAIEVLKSSPRELAFDLASTTTLKSDQTIGGLRGRGLLCGAYQAMSAIGAGFKSLYPNETFESHNGSPQLLPRDAQYFSNEATKGFGCDQMTNADVLRTLQSDRVLADYNRLMQIQLDKFQASLLQTLHQTRPQCHPKVVELPALFAGRLIVKNGQRELTTDDEDSGYSIYPNASNSVIVQKSVFFPEPYNHSFKAAQSQAITQLGLKAEFIDTLAMHAAEGDLHCSTQVFRYCRPREVSTNAKR